jgi:mannose-6-phosphate isomerase-like protein (cupin superfamily)
MDLKKDILFAKENNTIFFINNFINKNDVPGWNKVFDIFKLAHINNKINFNSFATCTIDSSEQYTDIYDGFIKQLENLHPGKKISALSIIHFITKYNSGDHHYGSDDFKDYFLKVNPNKIPEQLPPPEAFDPTIHSDPVDGFFIQLQGSTLWTIYYSDKIEKYTANSGDMIFIPKGLRHSVESLCPRNAVSISFTD